MAVTKIRALDKGMSSFLSDTYYYRPHETISASFLSPHNQVIKGHSLGVSHKDWVSR